MMRYAPSLSFLLAACVAPEAVPKSSVQLLSIERAEVAALADNLLLIDKSERKLTFYRGGAAVITVEHLALGDAPVGHKRFEGDERTPEGLYFIDARNPDSKYHLSLRISYPNAADRFYAESNGRDPGGDIFLHGQPNGDLGPELPGDWTDGCIAMRDAEIEALYAAVADGTPVYIRP